MKNQQNKTYTRNSLVHRDRRRKGTDSPWVQQFSCENMKPLIICRGPIRKEVMDVWEEMGMNTYGILLSEKDSITYNNALAPELRQLTDPHRIHRVPDYTGADKEERTQRINQIIAIAEENNYDSIFAGYGFMAEDEALVSAIEQAGLIFIGPCSGTVQRAGAKDEAKRTALACDVSVTPGVDNLTILTLLRKAGDLEGLRKTAKDHGLEVDSSLFGKDKHLEEIAGALLQASYKKRIDIICVDEICQEAQLRVAEFFALYPENRIRLKAIGGGGGKGQRILAAPSAFDGELDERIKAAAEKTPELLVEVLNEVKTNGIGDNKNVLIELNIETTRHQEIQVVGNGDWCMTLGARDCSLQMHEQKLLEVSQTREMLVESIERAEREKNGLEAAALKTDLDILERMEEESARFGKAVGLDSVSTFECIVDRGSHFFMEMNTRIQVEHRVSELCYGLKFSNPDDPADYFVVESLVEVMTLLAKFKKILPMPERIPRKKASVEARLNATNAALKPHAGGVIHYWSKPVEGEIRDDQGISRKNPDTGRFMKYHLAGAYDSNIALLLTTGENRLESYRNIAEILRRTKLSGENLETNLEFHYGLVHWFMAENVHAKATTGFVMPYLTMVGLLKREANEFDVHYGFGQIKAAFKKKVAAAFADSDQLPEVLKAVDNSLERKHSLLLRPLEILLENPHVLSGWLSLNKGSVVLMDGGAVRWLRNPFDILNETYHFLNMDYRAELPAAETIWKHDNDLLQTILGFYRQLEAQLGEKDYNKLSALLSRSEAPDGMDADTWSRVQAAHDGYQMGVEIYSALPKLAQSALFYDLKLNNDMTIDIPAQLTEPELQDAMQKVLVPPLVTKADELGAVFSGMYYCREAPGSEPYVSEGDHVSEGDPIYIIEVMKMFNKVYAPFSCTIDQVLVESPDGSIVKAGEPLFKVTPDDRVAVEDPAEVQRRRYIRTDELICAI